MFCSSYLFFFFNDTATTEIYTLSLHDALPISREPEGKLRRCLTDAEQSPGTARCASVPHNRNCPESLSATESSVPCPKGQPPVAAETPGFSMRIEFSVTTRLEVFPTQLPTGRVPSLASANATDAKRS